MSDMGTTNKTAEDLLALLESEADEARPIRQSRIEMDEDSFVVTFAPGWRGTGYHYSIVSRRTTGPTWMTRQIALRTLEAFILHEQAAALDGARFWLGSEVA